MEYLQREKIILCKTGTIVCELGAHSFKLRTLASRQAERVPDWHTSLKACSFSVGILDNADQVLALCQMHLTSSANPTKPHCCEVHLTHRSALIKRARPLKTVPFHPLGFVFPNKLCLLPSLPLAHLPWYEELGKKKRKRRREIKVLGEVEWGSEPTTRYQVTEQLRKSSS